jgi:hypothetical protein
MLRGMYALLVDASWLRATWCARKRGTRANYCLRAGPTWQGAFELAHCAAQRRRAEDRIRLRLGTERVGPIADAKPAQMSQLAAAAHARPVLVLQRTAGLRWVLKHTWGTTAHCGRWARGGATQQHITLAYVRTYPWPGGGWHLRSAQSSCRVCGVTPSHEYMSTSTNSEHSSAPVHSEGRVAAYCTAYAEYAVHRTVGSRSLPATAEAEGKT